MSSRKMKSILSLIALIGIGLNSSAYAAGRGGGRSSGGSMSGGSISGGSRPSGGSFSGGSISGGARTTTTTSPSSFTPRSTSTAGYSQPITRTTTTTPRAAPASAPSNLGPYRPDRGTTSTSTLPSVTTSTRPAPSRNTVPTRNTAPVETAPTATNSRNSPGTTQTNPRGASPLTPTTSTTGAKTLPSQTTTTSPSSLQTIRSSSTNTAGALNNHPATGTNTGSGVTSSSNTSVNSRGGSNTQTTNTNSGSGGASSLATQPSGSSPQVRGPYNPSNPKNPKLADPPANVHEIAAKGGKLPQNMAPVSIVTKGGATKTITADRNGNPVTTIEHPDKSKQEIHFNDKGVRTTVSTDAQGKWRGTSRIGKSGEVLSNERPHLDSTGKQIGRDRFDANKRLVYTQTKIPGGGYQKTYANGLGYRQSERDLGNGYHSEIRQGFRGNRYNNVTYVYHEHIYAGSSYHVYSPGYGGGMWLGMGGYHPFYSPLYSPFGYGSWNYGWSWGYDPWYNYYGSYWHPYPVYNSLSQWLVDATISTYLAESYASRNAMIMNEAAQNAANAQAQADQARIDQLQQENDELQQEITQDQAQAQLAQAEANAADAQAREARTRERLAKIEANEKASQEAQQNIPVKPAQPGAISDADKNQIQEQIKAEMQARGNEDADQRAVPIEQKMADAKHIFVVSEEKEVSIVDANGTPTEEHCTLTTGDLLKGVVTSGEAPVITVSSASSNDCDVGSRVQLSTKDLIDFENEFNIKLDEATAKAQAKGLTGK